MHISSFCVGDVHNKVPLVLYMVVLHKKVKVCFMYGYAVLYYNTLGVPQIYMYVVYTISCTLIGYTAQLAHLKRISRLLMIYNPWL